MAAAGMAGWDGTLPAPRALSQEAASTTKKLSDAEFEKGFGQVRFEKKGIYAVPWRLSLSEAREPDR